MSSVQFGSCEPPERVLCAGVGAGQTGLRTVFFDEDSENAGRRSEPLSPGFSAQGQGQN